MEREREKEKEEDRATKSCYPGRQGATKALIWVTLSLHYPFSTILNEVWPKRLPLVPAPRFVEIRQQVSNKGHLICILFVRKMERSALFFLFLFGTATREARDTS